MGGAEDPWDYADTDDRAPSFSPSASPAQERPIKLPSSGKHIYPGQAHPSGHTMALISRGARQRPSTHQVSHISCFHPTGQGWAQNSHILPRT